MLLIVSIIITAELYSTFKYHMKIGETTRCCSFFLRTHVKISSKISIIEFNIQIKWCIIVTPSREAEKDYQGYFNSPPHKKNHIATTMINTVLFKISTHIFTRRMTATCTNTTVSNIISTHILTKRMTEPQWTIHSGDIISTHILTKRMTQLCYISIERYIFQLTSSRRGWPIPTVFPSVFLTFQLTSSRRGWHSSETFLHRLLHFNSHPHEEDDHKEGPEAVHNNISTHILTKRMTAPWLFLM